MKKILSLLALTALTIGLLGSCSKMNERIDNLEKKVDGIENNQIATIGQQIATINQSIADLSTIRTNIQTLMDAKTAMGEDITKLKAADQTLEGKINDLKAYDDTELAKYATKDWANATFATLAKQTEIITDVEKLKTDLAGLDNKLDQAIANLDSSLKGWVNEQFSGYYTIAQVDAKVDGIQSDIDALKADNETNKTDIEKLEADLAKLTQDLATAKNEIKTAYEKAISDAINGNNGYINSTIKNAIDAANADITALTGRVETLESDVATLKNDVDALKAMIQTVSIIPAYSNGSLKAEDGILTINCVITPKKAVESLTKENFTILTSESEVLTKSALYGTLTIAKDEDLVLDKTNGTATIKVDVSGVLPTEEDKALTVAVNIKSGISDFTTEFVPVTVAGPDIPEGALPGVFSVSASKQVQFSKGNLVATIDAAGTPTAWKFAANQYDCLGEGGANKTIGTAAGDVDLFGWSTAATKYGISTSTTDSDYSGDFVDWGKNIGDGSTWRTLSNDEWVYLFETRTNASSLYKYGVTVCDKTNCLIIAPDGYTGTIAGSYDSSAWATAEAAGLVCLPAAGYRNGSSVGYVGDLGYYWSSSASSAGGGGSASRVFFHSVAVSPAHDDYRLLGFSVRLITDVAGSAPEEPVIDPLSGKFSVSASKQVQFSKGNLVATIDAAGTPTAWKFAANQYDCLGEGGANKTIGTAAGDVDLFGWSTASTTYGISTSNSSSSYSGDFVDWGKAYCANNSITPDKTWRTLTTAEWQYLFNSRTNASILYKYGVTVCDKTNCLIIAPDNWDTSANPLLASYDATAWATAEAAGLVCLPAAGGRFGSDVYYVGSYGLCWSSTADNSHTAYRVSFNGGGVSPDGYDARYGGFSVRLITESN